MPFIMIATVLNNNWCVIKYLHLLLCASELVCALKCDVFSLFFPYRAPLFTHYLNISPLFINIIAPFSDLN